jgi:HK97 family phage prohead protease
MSDLIVRSLALEDAPLEVSRAAGGRTLTGYLAVFDTPTEIADMHGQYNEQHAAGAFTKTIAERGNRFLVTYNHGKTLYGTPSAEFSIPLGVPTSVRADTRGVLADVAVDKTPLGDAILEGARSGSIPGMSYSGMFIKSTPDKPRGGYRPDRKTGALTLVTRTEVAMREFGPTPTPAYDAAAIIGVRALVQSIEGLSTAERAELIALLRDATDLRSSTPEEPVDLDTPTGAVLSDEPHDGALRSTPITPQERIARIKRQLSGITPGKAVH